MSQAIPNTPNEMENKAKVKPALPSAFPGTGYGTGMTLRDYFAAQCVSSFVSYELLNPSNPEITASHVAEFAYAMADAMMKVRKH